MGTGDPFLDELLGNSFATKNFSFEKNIVGLAKLHLKLKARGDIKISVIRSEHVRIFFHSSQSQEYKSEVRAMRIKTHLDKFSIPYSYSYSHFI